MCKRFLDIDCKKAAKAFAQKYSCGSSVTGPDEIVIQGDVLDDLLDFIPEKWPEVIIYIHFSLLFPLSLNNQLFVFYNKTV